MGAVRIRALPSLGSFPFQLCKSAKSPFTVMILFSPFRPPNRLSAHPSFQLANTWHSKPCHISLLLPYFDTPLCRSWSLRLPIDLNTTPGVAQGNECLCRSTTEMAKNIFLKFSYKRLPKSPLN